MDDEISISHKQGWLNAWVGDQLVMMNAESGVYLSLSGAGGRIWELLQHPRSPIDLRAALLAEYDAAPETVHKETLAFLQQLRHYNAIQIDFTAIP